MKPSEEQLFWLFITCIILLGITVVAWQVLPDYIACVKMPTRPNF